MNKVLSSLVKMAARSYWGLAIHMQPDLGSVIPPYSSILGYSIHRDWCWLDRSRSLAERYVIANIRKCQPPTTGKDHLTLAYLAS